MRDNLKKEANYRKAENCANCKFFRKYHGLKSCWYHKFIVEDNYICNNFKK